MVTVRVTVAVTLAHEQLALGVGAASQIFQDFALRHLNAIVVVINTFAGATRDRCCATTLETLETRVTVEVSVAVTLAQRQHALGVGAASQIFQGLSVVLNAIVVA